MSDIAYQLAAHRRSELLREAAHRRRAAEAACGPSRVNTSRKSALQAGVRRAVRISVPRIAH